MSFGMTLGHMANAFGGAHSAMEKMGKANLANEDIAFERKRRDRQKKDWERQDTLEKDLSQIPTQVTEEKRNLAAPQFDDSDDAENPTPSAASLPAPKTRATLLDEQLRHAAEAYKKAGQFGEFIRYTGEADRIAFGRAAQAFEQFDAGADGADLEGYIRGVAEVYTNDPFAGKVENIRKNEDGTFSYDAVNTSTGQRIKRTVKSIDEARNHLRAYYSPETFAKLQEAKREDAAKTFHLRYGDVVTDREGKVIANNPRTDVPGSGGSGSGGAGKPAPTPATFTADLISSFEGLVKESADKFPTPLDAQTARATAARVAELNPSLANHSDRAAAIALGNQAAITAATVPESVQPSFNPSTGRWEQIVSVSGTKVVVGLEVTDEQKRAVGPAQAMTLFKNFSASTNDKELTGLYLASAFDKSGESRRTYEGKIAHELAMEIAKKNNLSPTDKRVWDAVHQQMDKVRPLLQGQLNLLASSPELRQMYETGIKRKADVVATKSANTAYDAFAAAKAAGDREAMVRAANAALDHPDFKRLKPEQKREIENLIAPAAVNYRGFGMTPRN